MDSASRSASAAPARGLLTGRLGVLAAAALFSTGGTAIKATSLAGFHVASYRAGIAALALFLMLPVVRRRPTPMILAVALAHATTMILFVLSNKATTAASAIFLQSTAPLYILALSPWLLKEKIRRRDLILIAVLAVGLALFFVGVDPASSTAPQPLYGNLLALASGVFWAFTVIGLRALGRTGEGGGSATAALWGNTLACLICLPMALPMPEIGVRDLAALLYLGVFQIALAYVFLTASLRRVPAFEASLLLFLEPALSPLWAWFFHGEKPSLWCLIGGAVILAATAIKTWIEARESASESAAPVEATG